MPDPKCWKCLGTGEHMSCLEYGCDPEGCGLMECDCD